MELYSIVSRGIALAFFYPYISHGSVPFHISVTGNFLETGTRNFTYSNTPYTARILCYSTWGVDAITSFRKGGIDIGLGRFTRDVTSAGNYSCHISARLWKNKETYLSLSLVSSLYISIRQVGEPFCTTSVGVSGFLYERTTFYCTGIQEIGWSNTKSRNNYVLLSERELSGIYCRSGSDEEVTHQIHPRPSVLASLQLDIHPKIFVLSTSVLDFSCTSSPPRLIFWEVLGPNGDILDVSNGETNVAVNTNITIIQHPGYTTLKIEEATAGANGIHTVRCYTYDTLTLIAEARVVSLPTLPTGPDQVTRPPPRIQTNVPADGAEVEGNGQSNRVIGLIAAVSILTACVFIMGVIIAIMRCKIVQLKSGTAEKNGDTVKQHQETHLHDNRAFAGPDTTDTDGTPVSPQTYAYVDEYPLYGPELEDNPVYEKSDDIGGGEPEYTYATT